MSSSDKSPANWQDYTSAILSGFFGEWLHQRRNPMASAMELRFEDQVLSPASPDVTPDKARPTIILLIHGLTELETIFDYPGRPGENYGTELAAHLDATPLRLRYNTGRHISSNGDELDQALEQLLANWPVAVEKLILIGHSMGGLVTRSACHHAQQHQSAWISKLSACVYIGSPHEGSWLAKAAHKTADVMGRAPRDYLRAVSDFLNIRSPGIHDLTEGDIYPDREDFQQPAPVHAPLDRGAHGFDFGDAVRDAFAIARVGDAFTAPLNLPLRDRHGDDIGRRLDAARYAKGGGERECLARDGQ